MNLHQLKIFQVVAKHKNFTRAGEELYLSQPAVSIQIKELETELGINLFDQIGKKIYLSEAGNIMEEYTNKIFRVISETKQAIEDMKGLQRGHLHIGVSTTIAICLLPNLLARFKKEYPFIELHVGVENTSSIEK
ncbi:MAG: LysR family transcriptional regulator, partial [Nitrospinae bacterium]|nr:LysR family transcriptional regulator [Nitrospinota bacterium]